MKVKVHLHTVLQRETPEGMQQELDVTMLSGSSMMDLMADLGVVLPLDTMQMMVNGRLAEASDNLQDGDEVHLIPIIPDH